jgi:hypothetical protein
MKIEQMVAGLALIHSVFPKWMVPADTGLEFWFSQFKEDEPDKFTAACSKVASMPRLPENVLVAIKDEIDRMNGGAGSADEAWLLARRALDDYYPEFHQCTLDLIRKQVPPAVFAAILGAGPLAVLDGDQSAMWEFKRAYESHRRDPAKLKQLAAEHQQLLSAALDGAYNAGLTIAPALPEAKENLLPEPPTKPMKSLREIIKEAI